MITPARQSASFRRRFTGVALGCACVLLTAAGCTGPSSARKAPVPAGTPLLITVPHLERLDVSRCNGDPAAINTLLSERASVFARALAGSDVWYGDGLSMEPILSPGSWLVTQPTPFSDLKPGMIVLYNSTAGRPVVHALIRQTAGGWLVAGINNPRADSELVTAANCAGVIVGVFSRAPSPALLAQVVR